MKSWVKHYFNLLYNPLYDATTAQLPFYRRLQKVCLDKLDFKDDDLILCMGVGTGNEINLILGKNRNLTICGVDWSEKALKRAAGKAEKLGKTIITIQSDAHKLEFGNDVFTRVLCIHLMGFLADDKKATLELMRVLQPGGQFVITYPSGNGNSRLFTGTLRNAFRNCAKGKFIPAFKELGAIFLGGIVYLPGFIGVRPSSGFYSKDSLSQTLERLEINDYQIEEDADYQDLIVYGKKTG